VPRKPLSGRLVAIDIADAQCRVVEINATGTGAEVTGLASIAMPGPLGKVSPEALGQALRAGLAGARIGARQAVIGIPRQLAILKPVALPPMPPHETAAAVRLQAERELPYALAEACIDYAPTGVPLVDHDEATGEAPLGVGLFIGAVQKSVVDACRSLLEAAGLTPRTIALRPYGTATAMLYAGLNPGDDYVALVDLGEGTTEIDILRGRHVVFSRSVMVDGGRDPVAEDEDDEASDDDVDLDEPIRDAALNGDAGDLSLFAGRQTAVVRALRRSLEAFAVQPGGGAVSRVYLTGTGADDDRLAGAVAEALHVPVAAFDPFDRATLAGRASKADVADLPAYATALGLAMAECDELVPGFDFAVAIEERMRPVRSRKPITGAGVAAVLLAAVIALPIVFYKLKERRLKAAEAELVALREQKATVEKLRRDIADITPWTDPKQRASWSEVLRALNVLFPGQRRAYLTQLQGQKGNVLSISGRAQNPAAINELLESLKASPAFGEPDYTGQHVSSSDRLGYPVRFTIKVAWLGGASGGPASAPATRSAP